MKMKKIIILKNNGGRLANQLWLYSSVYAFCLEKKYRCENPSFFRYNEYFNMEKPKGFASLFFLKRICRHKLTRLLYSVYSTLIENMHAKNSIREQGEMFLLPPDIPTLKWQQEKIKEIETSTDRNFYFCGWLFRTPIGIEKYRTEIREYFKPKQKHLDRISAIIKPLRSADRYLVGVHIRHGDYRIWNNGDLFYSFEEVRKILEEYLRQQENPEKVTFVLCSDEKIDDLIFSGLPYVKGPGNEIEDLYILSYTDRIIGSNSSFGLWAAYYGDIPFEVFAKTS